LTADSRNRSLLVDGPEQSAAIIHLVLSGEDRADIVVLNARRPVTAGRETPAECAQWLQPQSTAARPGLLAKLVERTN